MARYKLTIECEIYADAKPYELNDLAFQLAHEVEHVCASKKLENGIITLSDVNAVLSDTNKAIGYGYILKT